MKNCWIVWDSHDEVVGVYESREDARKKSLDIFEDFLRYNRYSEEEVQEMYNEFYNEALYSDMFGRDGIVFCEKAKLFPNSLTEKGK